MTTEREVLRLRAAAWRRPTDAARPLLRRATSALRSGAWMEGALLLAVFAAIAGVRLKLVPWQSADYTVFLQHWYEHLQQQGFPGLGVQFADYNMPYLYLLYVGTALHVDALTWVKAVAFVSDFALAAGCAAILATFRLPKHFVALGAAAVLLLPEVLLNSAIWGQADSTYTALIAWALWGALRRRGANTAWICFALAFTFKLQAAFLLPVFAIAHITHRWRFRAIGWAALVALATEVPALIAGRSPVSLAQVYLDQANGYQQLTLNAPNVYTFLPQTSYDLLRPAGMLFAIASVGIVSYVVLRRARRGPLAPKTLLLFTTTLGLLAPFTLPQMHERYFYVGDVLLLVLALTDRRLLPVAFLAQAFAVMAYEPFLLTITPALPFQVLALLEAGIILLLCVRLFRKCGVSLTGLQLTRATTAPEPDRVPAD